MSNEYKRLQEQQRARQNLREAWALLGVRDDAPTRQPPMVAVTEGVATAAFARAAAILQRRTARQR